MSLYSQTIKNLVSGVSQQPAILRHPEQLEYQENGMSTEVGGLQKRPPTLHIKALDKHVLISGVKPSVHIINRDQYERYTAMFTGDGVHVWDMNGESKTVVYQDAAAKYYLTSAKPRDEIKAVTIADYTFVVNTNKTISMVKEPTEDTWRTQGALINVKSGQYGRTYKILINDTEQASYTTPDGSVSSHSLNIDTNYIAGQLKAQLLAKGYTVTQGEGWLYVNALGVPTSQTVVPPETASQLYGHIHETLLPGISPAMLAMGAPKSLVGNTVKITVGDGIAFGYDKTIEKNAHLLINQNWIYNKDYRTTPEGKSFVEYSFTYESRVVTYPAATTIVTVETKDGFNNQAMFGYTTSTQKFSNLPVAAPDGYTVEIVGESGNTADNYYVKYDAAKKVWKETSRPGIINSLDSTTMPHTLIRQADGTFIFKRAEWDKRTTGDEDSNPLPSFVDYTINDLFFFRNRLGLIAGENVVLSKAGEFFKFWMSSAIDVLDTDTIDLAVSHNVVSILYHAVPFDEELLLFSAQTQFILRAEGVLSPKNARIDQVTEFECSTSTRPIGAGRRLYFPTERASYSSIKEFYAVQDVTNIKNAQDVTAHVPSFIPNGVYRMISSTSENILLVLTEGQESAIYVYKYLFTDEQRVQASWSTWTFGSNSKIFGGGFIGTALYLVVQRGEGIFLEKMVFTYNTKDYEDEIYRIFLDRKAVTAPIPTENYDAVYNQTTLNLQKVYEECLPDELYGVVTPDGLYIQFTSLDIIDGKVILPGKWDGQKMVVGKLFTFRIEFSEQMLKTTDERGTRSDTEGRLQLKNMWINHVDSGYLRVTVKHRDKATFTYDMTGRILGSSKNTLGNMPLETGIFKFPIQGLSSNIKVIIESPHPVPLALIGAGWEGNYYRRSQRI